MRRGRRRRRHRSGRCRAWEARGRTGNDPQQRGGFGIDNPVHTFDKHVAIPRAGKHHRHAFILCQAGIDALSQGVTPTLKLEDRRPRIKVVFVASLTRVEQLKKFLPGHLGCVMVWGEGTRA